MNATEDRLSDALLLAQRLNYLLPGLPAPEISQSEHDGDFEFEWYFSSGDLAVVWNRDGHVSWAGMLGQDSSHGRSESDQVAFPIPCQELIIGVTRKIASRDAHQT